MLLARRQRLVMSSEISLVQSISPHRRSVMSLAPRRRSLISHHCLSLSLQASLLQCSLKVFHCTNFSLFFSLTLSQSLSLSLSLSEITEMKWMRVSLSLSLSLFFKTNFIWFFWTVIGWSFNFINILPIFWLFEFGFILFVGVGMCWCWDITFLLV